MGLGWAGPQIWYSFAGAACNWRKPNDYTCILGFGPEKSDPVEEPLHALRPVSVIGETVKGQHVMLGGPWRPPLPVLQADCNLPTPLQGKSGLEEHCEVLKRQVSEQYPVPFPWPWRLSRIVR